MPIRQRVVLAGALSLFCFGATSAMGDPVRITVLAHYVNWLQQGHPGWSEASILPLRHGSGVGEGYTSLDPEIIRQHNDEMQTYGITPLISWWGRHGTPSAYAGDDFLDLYLSIPSANKVVILYEMTGLLKQVGGRYNFNDHENKARFISDVVHLNERYFSVYPDRFLKINGRPAIFLWVTGLVTGDFVSAAAEARAQTGVYIIGSEYSVFGPPDANRLRIIQGFDAVSSYGTYWPQASRAHAGHADSAFTAEHVSSLIAWSASLSVHAPHVMLMPPLMFSFDDTKVPGRSRFNLPWTSTPEEAAYQSQAIRDLIAKAYRECANILPIVLFVSYNEHYEGSSLEPTDRYGYDFLNAIRAVFETPIAEGSHACTAF